MVAGMGRKTTEDTHGPGGEIMRLNDEYGWLARIWLGIAGNSVYASMRKTSPPQVRRYELGQLAELRAELEERVAQHRRFYGE
jgi:hypothetical protein